LSTFFQINLEVIRPIRSKDFSFGFAENIGKFVIFGGNMERSGASASFVELT